MTDIARSDASLAATQDVYGRCALSFTRGTVGRRENRRWDNVSSAPALRRRWG